MFKILIAIFLIASAAVSSISATVDSARVCNPKLCKPPDCRCSSTDIPGGLHPKNTPQFVLMTFDDAVTTTNVPYYRKAFYNRRNPNGCPAAPTYFVSHEYTDYSLVHELYHRGHEIALHSISHAVPVEYWRDMSVANLTEEFHGERWLISKFARIPVDAMKGIRLPFLQMSGDSSFEMLNTQQISYDCSWPSQQYVNPGLWPYTLDTKSKQDCVIGPCPKKSWNGTWVVPMLEWTDGRGYPCPMVDTCLGLPVQVDTLVDFMIGNFNRSYHSNRAPFGFYVHSAWFATAPHHFPAYVKFIDYLQTLNDVYIVGVADLLKWVQNPIPLAEMSNTKCRQVTPSICQKRMCPLPKGNEFRYMTVCTDSCPRTYPWVGNPFGR